MIKVEALVKQQGQSLTAKTDPVFCL